MLKFANINLTLFILRKLHNFSWKQFYRKNWRASISRKIFKVLLASQNRIFVWLMLDFILQVFLLLIPNSCYKNLIQKDDTDRPKKIESKSVQEWQSYMHFYVLSILQSISRKFLNHSFFWIIRSFDLVTDWTDLQIFPNYYWNLDIPAPLSKMWSRAPDISAQRLDGCLFSCFSMTFHTIHSILPYNNTLLRPAIPELLFGCLATERLRLLKSLVWCQSVFHICQSKSNLRNLLGLPYGPKTWLLAYCHAWSRFLSWCSVRNHQHSIWHIATGWHFLTCCFQLVYLLQMLHYLMLIYLTMLWAWPLWNSKAWSWLRTPLKK